MFVRYEDLRADTAGELARIAEFLGCRVEDGFVGEKAERHAFRSIPADERGPGRKARSAWPGSWRENLSPEECELMEKIMGETLRAWKYLRW